ncbi:fructosamine kinase family protein [Cecembia calidifontis]|uniref:fructosamine kinase family protein n=1 Tax=Cecembia calidifontis TaxID=1187080 RepID=UPI0026CB3056
MKVNFEQSLDVFEKEAHGLALMAQFSPFKIPKVFHQGRIEDRNFLLMEYIGPGRPSLGYWEELGVGLAQMHMATRPEFGLDEDNYIASLPQVNNNRSSWVDFFIHQRLDPMIGKAYYEDLIDTAFLKKFQSVYPRLTNFFPKEKPALLHGDLWSGNVMQAADGRPSLIDPAVYYGHREMDLAFSRLFGGFDEAFYRAYQEVFPLDQGFEERIAVYNLYPLLVHLLLFGKSYLPGIQKTIQRLL